MKKTVAVLFGGRSSEHEISVITGLEAINAIDTEVYDVIPVYIDLRGRWFTGDKLRDKSIYRNTPDSLADLKAVTLMPIPGFAGLKVLNSSKGGLFSSPKEEFIQVDVYLPAFHGQFGEDGCIQGLFELANVTYVGSGVTASSVAMSKVLCKSVLRDVGIPTLPEVVVNKKDFSTNLKSEVSKITQKLSSYPLFVKPVHLGSSIAVGRAENEAELSAALIAVFERDEQAIVEPCVKNIMEINISVLEDKDVYRASVVEIPVATDKTLTYEDKYMRGGKGKKGGSQKSGPQRVDGMAGLSRIIDPEDLDIKIKEQVTAYALLAAKTLQTGGVCRFDFMIDVDNGQLYFNELNSIPGSLAHYLWAKSKPNFLYTEILTIMIESAERNHSAKQRLKRDEGFRAL